MVVHLLLLKCCLNEPIFSNTLCYALSVLILEIETVFNVSIYYLINIGIGNMLQCNCFLYCLSMMVNRNCKVCNHPANKVVHDKPKR